METYWKTKIRSWDERREIIVAGKENESLSFCVDSFLSLAQESIEDHGFFSVALSGGSTPKAIFEALSKKESAVDWSRVLVFWSDERCVKPADKDSNYNMAMQAGLSLLPFMHENIHRMVAEENIEENALAYEKLIQKELPHAQFDLIMLGIGEDGHTASLFPGSAALEEEKRLVLANYVEKLKTKRMTFTYPLINRSKNIFVYALGKSKAPIVAKVLVNKEDYPIQKVGMESAKALWVLDEAAAKEINLC